MFMSTALVFRSVIDKSSLIRCVTASTTVGGSNAVSSSTAAVAVASTTTPMHSTHRHGGYSNTNIGTKILTNASSSQSSTSSTSRAMSSMHHLRIIRQPPTMTTHHHRHRHREMISTFQSLRQHSTMPSTFDDDDASTTSSSSSNNASKSTPFLLADIGEGIAEVELLQWYIHPGDTVSQFDRICEVQSDKAAVEITSRFDGVVEKLCGNVGDMMAVGRPLLYITTTSSTGGSASASSVTAGAAATANAASDLGHSKNVGMEVEEERSMVSTLHNVDDKIDRLSIPPVGTKYPSYYNNEEGGAVLAGVVDGNARSESSSSSTAKVLTSPAVRKLSKENHIDLGRVQGSGKGGRVLKGDVLKIIDPSGTSEMKLFTSTNGSNATPTTSNAPITTPPIPIPMEEYATTIVPIRGYNRHMVKSMTLSLQVPHMVYSDEINVDALTDVRDSLRPLATEMGITKKLSHMPFFIKATSLALTKYPIMNSTIDVENMTLTYHGEHRIGVAVDTARGLTVPVIGRCQEKSVLEIALELNRLYSLAMEGNLSEADIAKPTFTLSNIGAIGGTYMSPVVLPPQVGIGAMGKIHRVPRFIDDDSDKIEAVRVMPISWGGDHRAVDGATIARFSNLWKSYCENPASMMFAMR